MEFYWEIVQRDGSVTLVPPKSVEVVKRLMAHRQAIPTKFATIPYANIEVFRQTDKLYTDQRLLEDVSRAFREPEIAEDGSMMARWVKKYVSHEKWSKHYSTIGYKYLGDQNGMAVIAFRVPIHLVDTDKVMFCTEEEVEKLEKY